MRGIRCAVECTQAALALAPNFVRAHAELGETYASQGWNDFQPMREALTAAAAALKIELRNDSALSTTVYGTRYYN